MNILFSISSLGLGGQEKQLLDLIYYLNKKYQIKIFVFNKDLGRVDYLKNLNVEIFSLEKNRSKFFKAFLQLKKILDKEKIDIVYSFDLGSSVYSLFPSYLSKIKKYIAQFNGSFFNNKKLKLFLKLFYPLYFKIICNSFAGKDFLRSIGIPEKKLEVIPQGFNIQAMEESKYFKVSLKEELHIKKEVPLIGLVGKLNEDKDPIIFIKAAKIIHENFPDVIFCIIGDGNQKEFLESYIKENNMESYFLLIPKRADAPWLIKDFFVGVLSSRYEGLPNVLLEYMYWEKPVVVTNAGDCERVVIEGETGFVVPLGDYKLLAEKIIYFLKNKELAFEFGKRGKLRLEKEFSMEKQVERYNFLFLS